MIVILLTLLYVVVSVFLILVVLLQTGKRADLAGAFGGGGSQTAFGARGAANVLTKATTAAAVLFMITALALSIVKSQKGSAGSVLDEVDPAVTAPAPDPETTEGASVPVVPLDETPVDGDPATDSQEPPAEGDAAEPAAEDQP